MAERREGVAQLYRPSGRVAKGYWPLALLVLLAAAALGPIQQWLLQQRAYWPVMSPALSGMALGLLARDAARRGLVRSLAAAVAVPVAAGLLSIALHRAAGYSYFAARVHAERRADGATATEAAERFLAREVGRGGVIGLLLFESRQGGLPPREAKEPVHRATGPGYWLFLGIEAALAAGLATALSAGVARAPFCEACHAWQEPFPCPRDAAKKVAPRAAEALGKEVDDEDLEVVAFRCPGSDACGGWLSARRLPEKRTRFSLRRYAALTAGELSKLLRRAGG